MGLENGDRIDCLASCRPEHQSINVQGPLAGDDQAVGPGFAAVDHRHTHQDTFLHSMYRGSK